MSDTYDRGTCDRCGAGSAETPAPVFRAPPPAAVIAGPVVDPWLCRSCFVKVHFREPGPREPGEVAEVEREVSRRITRMTPGGTVTSRFHPDGQFRVQPGLTVRRLEGGAVEIQLWRADGTRADGPIVVHAQDWIDACVAVTPGARELALHDWQLRTVEVLALHEGR